MNCEVCGSEVIVVGDETKHYEPAIDGFLDLLLTIGSVIKPGESTGLTAIGKIAKIIEASHHSERLREYLHKNYYLEFTK